MKSGFYFGERLLRLLAFQQENPSPRGGNGDKQEKREVLFLPLYLYDGIQHGFHVDYIHIKFVPIFCFWYLGIQRRKILTNIFSFLLSNFVGDG